MNEILGHLGQIVVHDVRDSFDVNAARRNIGGDQHAVLAALESGERARALALRTAAMDTGDLHAVVVEFFCQTVGAVFGTRENEKRTFLLLQHEIQEAEFPVLVHFVEV